MIIAFICSFPALILVNWIWGLSGLLLGMIAGGIGIFFIPGTAFIQYLKLKRKISERSGKRYEEQSCTQGNF